MTVLYGVLALIALQRLAELVYANRNTRRLLARGGVEIGERHYPLFILLHGGWLAAMVVLVPAATPPSWPLIGVLAVLQGLRIWVIAALGPYWTTRIIT
jgi:methyltransferase